MYTDRALLALEPKEPNFCGWISLIRAARRDVRDVCMPLHAA